MAYRRRQVAELSLVLSAHTSSIAHDSYETNPEHLIEYNHLSCHTCIALNVYHRMFTCDVILR